ncbi:vacuolar protein sorting 55 [Choiromyces venosus 120613-1]|uniref:Vacuolar protein sorting 55 n=1 Tax=Choiromyces venosus 120613-1 TaxID=1336337 RepID=A0A3N4K3W4_9PEZI|nr:vacuolar protein sorting 55 [Choiromyces venosus 120613-1]
MAGLKTIIALSFVLAIGFLLVILSSALFNNYFPLLVVANYVLTPLPNVICARASASYSSFMSLGSDSDGAGIIDFGRFLTGFLVVTGIALPGVLAHSGIITIPAMIMAAVGGLLIYGTVICFEMFFAEEEDVGF